MSGFRNRLARGLTRIEGIVTRLFGRKREARAIEPYIGYATPEHLVLRGRVLAAGPGELREGRSRVGNARQMLRLFLTREVADVTVRSGEVTAQSDEEGYFTLLLPRGESTGWIDVLVEAGTARAVCPVMIADPRAAYVVVSDIDDTMMQTGAWSLWRNLRTSLTGTVGSRTVFGDARDLMQVLHRDGRNPVYFVSSSPWNFHGFLGAVFARNGLPRAPMFLRDYGLSDTQLVTGTHGNHKGSAIDRIAAAHPDLPLVLVGDLGQHDASIYADAVLRHPGRVAHVLLRQAGAIDEEDRLALERLRTLGVPVYAGRDFRPAVAIFGDGLA